jgi:branched-chain amino acid transport system permease protein
MRFFAEQLLNGLQLGALLFLMASGMTLILGIVRLINLAHGSLYMFGAFFAATFVARGNLMGMALVAAIVATALLGVILERLILRRLYQRSHLDQVLCTFGVVLFSDEVVRLIWGPVPIALPIPATLSGSIDLFGLQYSIYRSMFIVVGLGVAMLLHLLIHRTRTGMLIRAGASDRMMIQALGVNISFLSSLIFAMGAALAGLAGALAGPLLAVQSGMGEPVLIVVLVVIVVGGIGSISGSLVAALLIGLIDTFGRVLLPAALGSIIIYLVMAIILVFRPGGLIAVPGGVDNHSAPSAADSAIRSVRNYKLVTPAVMALLLAFALVPPIASVPGEPFYIKFFAKVMAVGVAAVGLGLIINYEGMVSFGHAAFVGVAGYVVAILGFHGTSGTSSLGFLATSNALVTWPAAVLVTATVAFLIGLVAVRTAGLSFIMVTLAFAQMLFYFFLALPTYGGESGLAMEQKSVLGSLPMDDRIPFYYVVFVVLVFCLALVSKLM